MFSATPFLDNNSGFYPQHDKYMMNIMIMIVIQCTHYHYIVHNMIYIYIYTQSYIYIYNQMYSHIYIYIYIVIYIHIYIYIIITIIIIIIVCNSNFTKHISLRPTLSSYVWGWSDIRSVALQQGITLCAPSLPAEALLPTTEVAMGGWWLDDGWMMVGWWVFLCGWVNIWVCGWWSFGWLDGWAFGVFISFWMCLCWFLIIVAETSAEIELRESATKMFFVVWTLELRLVNSKGNRCAFSAGTSLSIAIATPTSPRRRSRCLFLQRRGGTEDENRITPGKATSLRGFSILFDFWDINTWLFNAFHGLWICQQRTSQDIWIQDGSKITCARQADEKPVCGRLPVVPVWGTVLETKGPGDR